MSGGGGKTTKTTQNFTLPKWYEDAAKQVLAKGEAAASGGYTPWIGPDVAALSPAAKAGMAGADAMSAAFGMPTGASASYLPEEQTFAGGVKGYSSFPGFEQAMQALKTKYPGMYEFLAKYNKISQGSSMNPSQVTPFQAQVSPQFNATKNAFSAPGNKGPSNSLDDRDPFKMMSMLGGR